MPRSFANQGAFASLVATNWPERLLDCAAFDPTCLTFVSVLGLSYYLPQEAFIRLLRKLANLLPAGSGLAYDYPDELTFTPKAGERARKQVMMAAQAGEPMVSSYSSAELESLLEEAGLLAYEHLTPAVIDARLLAACNASRTGEPLAAFDNVHYCLAVKRS
ncbi:MULTISPECIES: class I SAM-dependent methyltransferase [Paenibacillus]|uniref:class I SAM-dependent methyltransferase n=1 Tax=Paenibacillus TaxID=44249 RepID=UPI000C7C1AFF|nr:MULTISPECIES: class I SAM-dependent methyltransferase [Paenibacillus]QGG54294.1 hypothetical protein GE073_00820 [Paenibacillus sp. B01]